MGESVFPAAESPSPIVPTLWVGVGGRGWPGAEFPAHSQWALGGGGSGEPPPCPVAAQMLFSAWLLSQTQSQALNGTIPRLSSQGEESAGRCTWGHPSPLPPARPWRPLPASRTFPPGGPALQYHLPTASSSSQPPSLGPSRPLRNTDLLPRKVGQ